MEIQDEQILATQNSPQIHWGHFTIIMATIILLVGISWMEKPGLFSFKKPSTVAYADVPHYEPYVTPAADLPQPEVLGASTNAGPSIINDDGSVSPVDLGQVLGASTQDVQLSPQDIKVNTVPDSAAAIANYLSQVQKINISPIDSGAFEAALSSNDQDQINAQANNLAAIRDSLQKLQVPQGFTLWQQLNIIQYNASISLLQNFTQADTDPTLVTQYLGEFIKSQEDLENESSAVAAKYNLDVSQLTAGVLDVSQLDGSLTDSTAQDSTLSGADGSAADDSQTQNAQ